MLYDEDLKDAVVGILEERVPAIANHIGALLEQGYIPNKNKSTMLNWSILLIHAYENIDVLSKEQHKAIDSIYNKILKL